MDDIENPASDESPQTDGPTPIPISLTPSNPGPITAPTTVGVTAAINPADATGTLTVTYWNNGNNVTPARLSHPVWSNDGTTYFQVAITQALVDSLSSHTTTLVVTLSGVTSNNDSSVGSTNISIAFPP